MENISINRKVSEEDPILAIDCNIDKDLVIFSTKNKISFFNLSSGYIDLSIKSEAKDSGSNTLKVSTVSTPDDSSSLIVYGGTEFTVTSYQGEPNLHTVSYIYRANVYDTIKRKDIADVYVGDEICNVKILNDYLFVILKNAFKIYSLKNEKAALIITISTFLQNTRGTFACFEVNDTILMAYPGREAGTVCIRQIDTMFKDKHTKTINAHQNGVTCIASNKDGSLIATASEKGTIIRIFDVETAVKYKEFRRGAIEASVDSISFSNDSKKLCVSSSRGTIHIFHIEEDEENQNCYTMVPVVGYFSEYFSSSWSFHNFQLPELQRCICLFSKEQPNTVMAISYEGNIYTYEFGKENATVVYERNLHEAVKEYNKKTKKEAKINATLAKAKNRARNRDEDKFSSDSITDQSATESELDVRKKYDEEIKDNALGKCIKGVSSKPADINNKSSNNKEILKISIVDDTILNVAKESEPPLVQDPLPFSPMTHPRIKNKSFKRTDRTSNKFSIDYNL